MALEFGHMVIHIIFCPRLKFISCRDENQQLQTAPKILFQQFVPGSVEN